MYRRFVSVIYLLNILFQAFFTLLFPIALGLGASWLLVRFASIPTWIYAPLVTLGALAGIYSMIRFILSAMSSLERLEKEHKVKNKKN